MPIKTTKIDTKWKGALLALAAAACAFGAWHVSKWGLANSAAYRAEDADVAQYLARLAPSDPQTHYASAVFLERSFDPADIEKALAELETATALSPHNYLLWLELGRARERSGDAEGAERALRRALALAPNYSRVQWALGNALLRQGRTDEAFQEIRKAVVGDPGFAEPAASAAWQFFDGDIDAIRRAMDGSGRFEASLAALLVREKRFEDAMSIWDRIPTAEKPTTYKETGTVLARQMLDAKRFRDALRLTADIDTAADLSTGRVTNGGFESAVKTDAAGAFDWRIDGGLEPQIVLSDVQKHGGSNSLYLIFNSNDAKTHRAISQTIAVEPGTPYELDLFYRSELKTAAEFRWEIADAVDGKRLAISDAILPRADWTQIRIPFKTPVTSDGVVIRLVREACGQICPVNGNLWFDDISLRR